MLIEVDLKQKPFSHLNLGDTFTENGKLYMRVESDKQSENANCVNLGNGHLFNHGHTSLVTPIKTKAVALEN